MNQLLITVLPSSSAQTQVLVNINEVWFSSRVSPTYQVPLIFCEIGHQCSSISDRLFCFSMSALLKGYFSKLVPLHGFAVRFPPHFSLNVFLWSYKWFPLLQLPGKLCLFYLSILELPLNSRTISNVCVTTIYSQKSLLALELQIQPRE